MSAYEVIPPNEEILLGANEGSRLSPIRRFFCLLVTFDFLFIVLLWSICVILEKGPTIPLKEAFEQQVLHYNLEASIFDLVLLALSRFIILLLFYGLLKVNHWLAVSITTAGTCAFLIVKVFLFTWTDAFPLMPILASFVLSWLEAWYMDFRVVAHERLAAIFFQRYGGGRFGQSLGNDHEGPVLPWLQSSVPPHLARHSQSHVTQSYPESVANFYSPIGGSPIPSDNENEPSETESTEKRNLKKLQSRPLSPEERLWIQQGPTMAVELINRIRSSGWVLEKSSPEGDRILSIKLHRKLFMISGILPAPPDLLIKEFYDNFDAQPNWNPNVTFCEVIEKLNETTDITYTITKDATTGVISPRDFVALRFYKHPDPDDPFGMHTVVWSSVKHSEKPKQASIVRGTNGISGWIMSPTKHDPNQTEFQFLLDVDLHIQGWIPAKLVDQGLVKAAFETIRCFRLRLACGDAPSTAPSHSEIDFV